MNISISFQWNWMENGNYITRKERVCNQTTRIVLCVVRTINCCIRPVEHDPDGPISRNSLQRVASWIKVWYCLVISQQLTAIERFDVSTIVLEKVGQSVIHKDGCWDVRRDTKLDRANVGRMVVFPWYDSWCRIGRRSPITSSSRASSVVKRQLRHLYSRFSRNTIQVST